MKICLDVRRMIRRMESQLRIASALVTCLFGFLFVEADNFVVCTPSDSLFIEDIPKLVSLTRNNESSKWRNDMNLTDAYFYKLPGNLCPSDGREEWSVINFRLRTRNESLRIDSVEWIRLDRDGRIEFSGRSLQPFSLDTACNADGANSLMWDIHIEYPFEQSIYEDDELVIHTDKGDIREFIRNDRRIMRDIQEVNDEYGREVKMEAEESRRIAIWWASAVGLLLLMGVAGFFAVRLRLRRNQKKVLMLSMLVAERTEKNKELESKVNELYASRLDTLNLLCNKYFESRTSTGDMNEQLFEEIEKHIFTMKSRDSVARLEELVDRYLDGIMSKVRVQIPDLDRNELCFLLYIYAGFSPRAVCIFTGIKMQNFYKRRERLRDRILGSNASDKKKFVARMGMRIP